MPSAKVGTQWFAVDSNDQPTGSGLDIEIAYETYGSASAPPLLLCNGVSMQVSTDGLAHSQPRSCDGVSMHLMR